MKFNDGKKVIELVEQERYEEALGISLNASKRKINKAHITLTNKFRSEAKVKKALSIAKNDLINESIPDQGVRFVKIQKFKKAFPYLKKGLKIRGSYEDYYMYGKCLLMLGKDEKGMEYMRKGAKMSNDPKIMEDLELILKAKSKISDAKSTVEKTRSFEKSLREKTGLKLDGDISKSDKLVHEAEKKYREGDYVKALKLSLECISYNTEMIRNFNRRYG